jgi:outer membrane protein OmpA-like peptidoglycan-associated protein
LDSSTGPTFAFGSAALSGNAKREIDQFFGDLEGSTGSGSAAAERVFVVPGYTDSVGHEDYNYDLGQRRVTSVAGYLVGKKGPRPNAGSRGFLRCEQASRRQQHTERSA